MAGVRNSGRTSGRAGSVGDGADESADRAVAEAADSLYAGDPDGFMARRAELSAQAKQAGSAVAAKRIGALRKPTVAASIVNRLVLADPSLVDDILDLGARLRAAQDALDAPLLRDLSSERRALVAGLGRDAVQRTGAQVSTSVRDEITSTFDAAVAEPDVAARLGRLVRAESWSGFGFGAGSGTDAAPGLTLVRGGRDTTRPTGTRRPTGSATRAPTKPEPQEQEPKREPAKREPAAARRKLARALDKARDTFASAESALTAAESSEQTEHERVRTLGAQLAELQHELDAAKRSLEQARREAKAARSRRREARSALDRAERHSGS